MPRRSTKGPLDLDDDMPKSPALSSPVLNSPIVIEPPPHLALQTSNPSTPSAIPADLFSPTSLAPSSRSGTPRLRSPSPNFPPGRGNSGKLDLSPLLRANLYTAVPTTGIPPPFLHSPHQPHTPSTTLDTLLARGFCRLAAEKAAEELTSGTLRPFDPEPILALFHKRLAALILAGHAPLAAKEAKVLLDILARESSLTGPSRSSVASVASSTLDVTPINVHVSWPLRLLLERLKVVGTGDSRAGIMALYALGSTCRAQVAGARRGGDEETAGLWRARARDLGIRVAGLLVEMGELEVAGRHLEALTAARDAAVDEQLEIRKAMLWLQVGHVDAARACLSRLNTGDAADAEAELVSPLIDLCDGKFEGAAAQLAAMQERRPECEIVAHNLAVAELYAGRVTHATELLEGVVGGRGEQGKVFEGTLFNLCTMYELRTERAQARKVELVERLAEREPHGGNFERPAAEFKL